MKFFLPFLGLCLLSLASLQADFPELPFGGFVQKDGDLKIHLRPKNQILMEPGMKKEKLWIGLDCFAAVRNEFWCRIKTIGPLKKKTNIETQEEETPNLQSNPLEDKKNYKKQGEKKSTIQNLVLGQKKAREEKAMPPLLPKFQKGTLWIFVIQKEGLRLLAEVPGALAKELLFEKLY